MLTKQQSNCNRSTLLLVSDNEQLSHSLKEILKFYFPAKQQDCHLEINNKYYNCSLKIEQLTWKNTLKTQQNIQYKQKPKCADFLLMLSQGTSMISPQIIDGLIDKYQPASHILVTHIRYQKLHSEEQNIHSSSPLAQGILQCNNFIQIVFEDLDRILNLKPEWRQNALLSNDEQQQFAIYSLFDLLHTTSWSTITKKQKPSSKEAEKQKKQQKKMTEQPIVKQQVAAQQNPQSKKQSGEINQEQPEEVNQKMLQSQMMQFEAIMAEMASLKVGQLDDKTRKNKAQDIFKRLAKDFMM